MLIYQEYQPLRVSADWRITRNCFFEIDPNEDTMYYFPQELLWMESERRNRSINLEWKPEDDPNGEYVLTVINTIEEFDETNNCINISGDWANPHLIFTSKKRLEIVAKLEELMFFLEEFKDERILKSRGIVDEKLEALRLKFLEKGYSKNIALEIIESKSIILQRMVLNSKNIDKEMLLLYTEKGAKKAIKNIAKTLLKNKKL
ncbi:hypothetical protein [uncultured Polaribacter sp.]|uniref:hypothetical protein n=1 Tax=uncultured Polaribacter sp. TaxID=174711 RepID=UPI0026380254|nr:hypothetical protein [uncultured Polaribacter sp.]